MKKRMIFIIIGILVFVVAIIGVLLSFSRLSFQISQDDFKAPGRNWPSSKKVEDYFIERLRMTPEDLKLHKDRTTVDFRLSKETTLDGIVGNLHYYGFIRSEKALRYALEHTEDKTAGHEGAIKVGKNGTIDINASYRISEDMSAWEIADTLLNKSHYYGEGDPYNYLFMP